MEKLLPLVYDELRRLAALYFRRERSDHTLQPTALVHEAYLKLVDQPVVRWESRGHFPGVAATERRSGAACHRGLSWTTAWRSPGSGPWR